MKKYILLVLVLFANLTLAHANRCDAEAIRLLLNEAPVVRGGEGYKRWYEAREMTFDQFKARIGKASSYDFNWSEKGWLGPMKETNRVLRILDLNPQSTYVAYEIHWRGWMYRPTNIDADIYHSVLIDTRHCEVLTPANTYFHHFLGEELSWLPPAKGRDW